MKQSRLYTIIIFGLIAFVATMFFLQNRDSNNEKFTAVFMQTGQVYFGNVDHETSDQLIISNIYYLQFAPNGQNSLETNNGTEFNLIKRGQELHGPEDTMKINKQFILFTEELRPDSKIVDTINSSK